MISLIRDNCDFLQQGIDLLERHSPETYVKGDPATFGSSVGVHMRHVLDHYASFIVGAGLLTTMIAREISRLNVLWIPELEKRKIS